jgi:hypothetical protein
MCESRYLAPQRFFAENGNARLALHGRLQVRRLFHLLGKLLAYFLPGCPAWFPKTDFITREKIARLTLAGFETEAVSRRESKRKLAAEILAKRWDCPDAARSRLALIAISLNIPCS